MSTSDEEAFFRDIRTSLDNLDEHLSAINRNLKHYEIEAISKNTGAGSLEKQFKTDPNGVGAFGPIEKFIKASVSLKDKLEAYTADYSLLWGIEQTKVRQARQNERRDMWILWSQKLIRWCVGTIVAVFIYSCVVWLSEQTSFIKVPIKDWIHSTAP